MQNQEQGKKQNKTKQKLRGIGIIQDEEKKYYPQKDIAFMKQVQEDIKEFLEIKNMLAKLKNSIEGTKG